MISDKLLNDITIALEPEFKFIGIGTGVVPTITDTLMSSEALRKPAINFIDGSTIIAEIQFDETEANLVNYTNSGAFGGAATSTINTGALLAGFATSFYKTNVESITISYEILVERGA